MKRIYVGDELLELDDETLDYMYIDEGNEAEIYRYGQDALKLYKNHCTKIRLNEEAARYLSNIPTERFLMPKEIIRDAYDLEFIGYSLPFVYVYPRKALLRLRIEDFLKELAELDADLHVLADYGVAVEDVHIDNVLYNGKIFVGDPGSFSISREVKGDEIYRQSTYELSRLVREDIFGMVPLSRRERKAFNNMFFDSEYIGYQIEDTADPKETVRQYVKRLTR